MQSGKDCGKLAMGKDVSAARPRSRWRGVKHVDIAVVLGIYCKPEQSAVGVIADFAAQVGK
jgi:hypothetical protein